MPTLAQIKSVQGITNPLVKQKYLRYFQLPQDIRQIFFALETADQIYNVAKRNGLNDNQLWGASYTAGLILLGEINIINFVKALQEKCKLREEPARQLARDINQAIFLPVKESLKQIHKVPEWPREREPEPQQTKGPQINGNVVDLKRE